MSSLVGQQTKEKLLIQKCLAGEAEALTLFQTHYLEPLRPLLLSRGATVSSAEELLADLWTDCVVGRANNPPLLEKYNGKSSLRNWVFRVGLNRYYDGIRRSPPVSYLPAYNPNDGLDGRLAETPTPALPAAEGGLLCLLHDSLREAFEICPAEDVLKLRLAFLHGLTHRELARMWACHETTIGRDLDRAMHFIADRTMQELKRKDSRLMLTWEDFLLLCQTEDLDFL